MNGCVPEQEVQDVELQNLEEEKQEESRPDEENPLNPRDTRNSETTEPCLEIVFWKCKLWMILTSAFLCLILVIIISLTLYSVVYIDEDEYWDLESIANGSRQNFTGMLKIHCANPDWLLSESAYHLLSENLSKRLADVYNNSPALGRYFISAKVISLSYENKTAFFELEFSVPPECETEEFMKNRMSEMFVKNILRQNIYDRKEMYGVDVTGCTYLTLDPTSLSVLSI
ncbi:TPA-induced transmembrane protein isoform X2 [Paroedura picta]|uniref:TPA-induced transmembrane protein isoform X2 n=1 Tax=Paroedura picta TaxID=143630 RepID=UPI004056C1B1